MGVRSKTWLGFLLNKWENILDKVMLMFQSIEPDGKVFRVFADGRTEGFSDGAVIFNNFIPYLHCWHLLSKKALDHGLISAEEAASLFP